MIPAGRMPTNDTSGRRLLDTCTTEGVQDLATVFRVKTEAGQHMVALAPYTGEVLEVWDRRGGLV